MTVIRGGAVTRQTEGASSLTYFLRVNFKRSLHLHPEAQSRSALHVLTMAWRLRATRLAMGGAAGILSASFANCNTATQTDAAAKLKSTLSSGSPPISVAPDHMLFAIPKKGRLNEKIVAMLKGSGFDYSRPERLDIAHCKDLPVSIVFLPASDIATYVAEGNVDLGITGEDMIEESGATVNLLMKLGFGKCRLSVQAPRGDVQDVRQLAGKRCATAGQYRITRGRRCCFHPVAYSHTAA